MSDSAHAPTDPIPTDATSDPAPPASTPPSPPPRPEAPPPPPPQAAAGTAHPGAHSHYATAPVDPRRRSPFLAGLLSLVPGLGQVYTGYYQRGFVHAFVVAAVITFLASGAAYGLIPLAAIFLVFFWLYNVIDAVRRASLYNQALAGLADIELPEDWRTPGFRGSIVGGSLITALGVVLLLETVYDLSFEWLEEWWPVAVIVFGLYLIYKAVDDRRKRAAPESD